MQTAQQRTVIATAAATALLANNDYCEAYTDGDVCYLDVLDGIVPTTLSDDEYNDTLQEFHTQMTAAGYSWPQ